MCNHLISKYIFPCLIKWDGCSLYLWFVTFRYLYNFCTIIWSLFFHFKSGIKEGSFIYLHADPNALITSSILTMDSVGVNYCMPATAACLTWPVGSCKWNALSLLTLQMWKFGLCLAFQFYFLWLFNNTRSPTLIFGRYVHTGVFLSYSFWIYCC